MSNFILYFDPGLGALIAQGIAAIVAGFVLFSKNAMYKIKSFLGLYKPEPYDDIDIDDDMDNKPTE